MSGLGHARLVVVTGGGKGIGRAIVEGFARLGDRVVAVGRDAAVLEATARGAGERVSYEVCDVTDEAAVGALFKRLGEVDVLVNNAGASSSAPVERTTLEEWNRQLQVNVTGVFLCTRAALPAMRRRNQGRIVTVASTAALSGSPYIAGYAASKHAALGFMRVVAAEVAGTGVTANCVCPHYVRSEMTERSVARIAERTGRSPAQAQEALAGSSPLGRLIEPQEVAAAVAYLASEQAAAINGHALVLDGGGLQR